MTPVTRSSLGLQHETRPPRARYATVFPGNQPIPRPIRPLRGYPATVNRSPAALPLHPDSPTPHGTARALSGANGRANPVVALASGATRKLSTSSPPGALADRNLPAKGADATGATRQSPS